MLINIIFIIILLILILTFQNIENFYTASTIPTQTAYPLELNTQHMVDPTGWKWESNNTITTIIQIKALTGQLDFQNIMAIPTFGYHQDSGLQYSSVNNLQNLNGWDFINEARHGHEWFWWQLLPTWQNKTDIEKSKILELKLIIKNTNKKPEFPISFGIKIHDFNYNNVLRFWLTFTQDPINGMSHSYNKNILSKHIILPPLILKNNNVSILPSKWKIINNIAYSKINLIAQQGDIDINNIFGNEKNNNKSWFSWSINNNLSLNKKNIINIFCKINNNYKKPFKFPVYYKIYIKDNNMERYVILNIKIIENPYK